MESFHQVLRSLWRKRWTGLAAAWVVVLLGGLAVTLMKDRYEASSRVYVNTQTVLKPLMQGLAQQPNIDQQVEMLARTLVSRPNAEKLLQDPALAPKSEPGEEPLTEAQKAAAVTGLMKQIKVMPGSPMTAENGATVSSNLYTISYSDADPQRAQLMVDRLLALFMDSMVQSKVRDSQEARQFIDQQIALYEKKLQEAENQLKEFKLRNFGTSGSSAGDHFSRMSVLADEVSRLQIELRAAEQSRDALRRELASVRPTVTGDTLRAAGSPRLMEIDSRIDADRRQLDELTRRFTDAHPDIVALRESIARLQAERQQAVRQALASGAGAAAAGNPVFERVRVSLAEAEASVASLRTRLASEQARLEQARALGARMPGVEAELARLNRDYEGVQRNYQELVSRRASAAMVENMDETQHMADFRVVEPPRVAPEPVGPTRKTFALMVVVLALVAGALTAWAMGWLQPSFSSERRLEALTGRPVLGRISMALSPDMQAQLRRDHVQFASATGLFFVGCAAWLAWLVLQSRI